MQSGSQKFLFDLSPNEIAARLNNVVINVLIERKALNLPFVYKNSLCTGKNQFIHEYPDGRKFLIRQNRSNSEEKVIRQL